MTLRKPRIFYVGMVCTSAYAKTIGEHAFVGAAAGKMSSVVGALRRVGRRAVLVSLPFVGNGAKPQPCYLCTGDGFPALFLPLHGSPAIRKVIGIFSFAWFAIRLVRPQDRLLFYNHSPEYLLALLILRIRGVSIFQDVEDIPISNERGLRGILNRLGYVLTSILTSPRKVTVSNQVGRALHLRDYLAIQGIAAETVTAVGENKWAHLAAGAPLRVHYGGSLMVATGLNLFCDAVSCLASNGHMASRKIEFIVTGVGELHRILSLASEVHSDWLSIEVHQGVSRAQYFDLLDSCHASLSLKSPESEISSTTFPSKVIEISSRGLALITTEVSDVGDIFIDNSAWLLPEFSVQALINVLKEMTQTPTEVRCRAKAGQALVRSRFAPLTVGQSLAEFLEVEPTLS